MECPLAELDQDKNGEAVLKSVWCSGWQSGSGTPSVSFSVWANMKTAAEAINNDEFLGEQIWHYSKTICGTIMCALDGEGELVFLDELNSPSSGGSGAPNTGAIYAQYPAPAEGKYMMVSYLGSSVAEADSRIRALTGGYNSNEPAMESVTWKLLAFPSDADVLENLRQQVNNGDVIMKDEDGNAIPADRLTTDNYVVRWIQVKYQSGSGDGWNINAILKSKFDYTVRYDANGGEGTMSDQIIRYDETVALTENAFTRAHYRFVGWKDGAPRSGRFRLPESE